MIGWLDARGQDWKNQIQIVAMDPFATYRAMIRHALPNALVLADHFHLVALANQAGLLDLSRWAVHCPGMRVIVRRTKPDTWHTLNRAPKHWLSQTRRVRLQWP